MTQDNGEHTIQTGETFDTGITDEQLETQHQDDAKRQMEQLIAKRVGDSVGHLEAQIKELNIVSVSQFATIKSLDNRLESVELQEKNRNEETAPALTLTGDQKLRLRIGHTVSVKGIHTYDGTVEGEGLSQQQLFAARIAMDADMEKLQPIYTEFVEPEVPGLTVANRFEVPEESATETPETLK